MIWVFLSTAAISACLLRGETSWQTVAVVAIVEVASIIMCAVVNGNRQKDLELKALRNQLSEANARLVVLEMNKSFDERAFRAFTVNARNVS